MKKVIILVFLTAITFPALCDVIFFPYPFTGFCYSTEIIFSFEKVKKAKNTTDFWGGIGHVGSFIYRFEPTFGFELAIEKRHYFQPDKFKNFFVSAYLGTALMTQFENNYSIGIIPGCKINYKVQITEKLILEPYLSLSLPITYELNRYSHIIPFPALTIGVRFGLSKIKYQDKNET
jgi:hypothetical protein